MLNDESGRTFVQLMTPQVKEGSGESATMLPGWRGEPGALIIVNNGLASGEDADDAGPWQAIHIV